ncbi:MAG: flagellin lysine-N-methylase [Clostridia bacterium]|nr:flagellin lysine-N-methylase [Clostridia bacterium]
MKLIAPDYYPLFSCIADKCKHSCCIGWEIDIDAETLETYKNVQGDFGKRLREGIDEMDGTACFHLCEDERCPFLNEKGLCDIILNLGEDALSQICTDHPRFCSFYSDRTEIGLGLCCEEAGRIILSHQKKTELIVLDDDGGDEMPSDDDILFAILRSKLFSIAQNREKTLDERMKDILSLFGTQIPKRSFREWVDIYFSLDRMDDSWSELLEKAKTFDGEPLTFEDEIPFEQLLVYFIYRHLSDMETDAEKIASFAVLSVWFIRMLCAVWQKTYGTLDMNALVEICRLYSSEIEYSEENTSALLEEWL